MINTTMDLMDKFSIIAILCIGSIITPFNELLCQSVTNSKIEPLTKWMVGSEVSLAFGKNFKDLKISPFIGYRLAEKFEAGIKTPIEQVTSRYRFENRALGIGLFSRYYLIQQLFLYIDYGCSSINKKYIDILEPHNTNTQKFWSDFSNIGIGFRSCGRLGAELRVNYNIINKVTDPFNFSDKFNLESGVIYKF